MDKVVDHDYSCGTEDLMIGRFRVHIVWPGDRYGLNNACVYEQENADQHGPLIEFYDMSQDPTRFPGGQFVSRYYFNDFLDHEAGYGLDLYGSVKAWTISAEEYRLASSWLLNRIVEHSPSSVCPESHQSWVNLRKSACAAADVQDHSSRITDRNGLRQAAIAR